MPTTALFGAGKLNELHTWINTPTGVVHGKKALVVISNGKSTRANGYLERLENELKQASVKYVVFDKDVVFDKAAANGGDLRDYEMFGLIKHQH